MFLYHLGFMYFPWSWNDRKQIDPHDGLMGGKFGFEYAQPNVTCDPSTGAQCSSSALSNGWTTDWFTNFTFIPATGLSMSEDMYDPYPQWTVVEGDKRYNPWAQPGTAPVYGGGCGANGGNPTGCQGYYEDSSPFGTCCTKSKNWIGK